jgi:hypothetical protein
VADSWKCPHCGNWIGSMQVHETTMNRTIDISLEQADMNWNDDVALACRVRSYYVEAKPAELQKVRAAYERNIKAIDAALARAGA